MKILTTVSSDIDLSFSSSALSRRTALISLGATAGLVALTISPISVRAEIAEINERLGEVIKNKFGSREIQEGLVSLKLPNTADTGLSVPATISVDDSPMNESDYVKSMHIITELNPQLEVADYYLTPKSGKAMVSTRIRLKQSQNVFAFALLSDNSLWATSVEISVTMGACAAEIFLPDEKEQLRERLRQRAGEDLKGGCRC